MSKKNSMPMLMVLFCASFIAAFNENIVNVGLVDIMTEFSIDSATAQWLVTGYMIVTAIVVALMAFMMKRFSLRVLFFTGSFLLVIGSVAASLAPSFPLLLAARLVQAGGSGIFIPAMMNTVLAVTPKSKLGAYLSIGGCTITFGPALAPVVSGFMVTMIGWRSVFAVPAVFVALLAVFGFFSVRKISEPEQVHLDLISAVLSTVGLTLFVVGLGQVTSNVPLAIATIALGIGCIVFFSMRQKRLDEPMIDLSPLRKPPFLLACILVIVAMMTTFSMSVLLPLYFEGAVGLTALTAGILILVPILVNALTTIVGGRTVDHRGTWPLLPLGFFAISSGLFVTALAGGLHQALPVMLGSIIVYAGVGLVFSPSQTAGLRNLTREEHPFGVGIMSTFIQIAACIGPALFVGILSTTAGNVQTITGDGTVAQARGFTAAVIVAALIGASGLIVSLVYTRKEATQTTRITEGAAAKEPHLSEVMETNASWVSDTANVTEAMRLMLQWQTTGLPVMDSEKHVVGFISDGDIMNALADHMPTGFDLVSYLTAYQRVDEVFDERIAGVMGLNVMDLATKQVISVEADTPLPAVCKLLGTRRIKKVPVISEKTLIGTVSREDVSRFLMDRSMLMGPHGL